MPTSANVAVVHHSSTGTISTVADGNPYGTSHGSGQGDIPVGGQTPTAARVQAERVVRFTRAIKAGLAAEN